MQENRLAAVILAAGKGTRMKAPGAKVLQKLAGRPLLSHLLESVRNLAPDRLVIVVGYQAKEVMARFQIRDIEFALQEKQLGTAHAVAQAESSLTDFSGDVLILCGDMPLLKQKTLEKLIGQHRQAGSHCTLLTVKTSEKKDFGLVLRDEKGNIARIVEQKDATEAEKRVDEYNAGVYCLGKELLFSALKSIENNNVQKEYYLTDIIKYMVGNHLRVHAMQTTDADEVFGINTEDDLKKAESIFKDR
jgi:UDP-N-acetylglucosamine diphosphorylase/glucosamine-1-phosphate N-acetyltransferase